MTVYICLEGGEGTYKTTTAKALTQHFRDNGLRVLETKEPGTSHLPLTMKLREIMLSNEYNDQLTMYARELISQAIRSIHMEKLILPAVDSGQYDVIVQDRGILSGMIYAEACGVNSDDVDFLIDMVTKHVIGYDYTFIFTHDQQTLDSAIAKKEFEQGDAMESAGKEFHDFVNAKYKSAAFWCDPMLGETIEINVTNLTTEQIINAITDAMK